MRRGVRLLASALCGVAACVIAYVAVTSAESEAQAARNEALAAYGGDVVPVCVATRELEAGDELDASCVETRDWAVELLPEGALTSLGAARGRKVAERVPKGAVISEAYFAVERGALEVPDGAVAVSLPLQPAYALGGAFSAGDEVDVYVTSDGVVNRLAEGCRVLDANTFSTDGSGSLEWATLAVAPEAVGELLAASARGTVALAVAGEDGAADPAPSTNEAPAPEAEPEPEEGQ